MKQAHRASINLIMACSLGDHKHANSLFLALNMKTVFACFNASNFAKSHHAMILMPKL